jgi:hypothetical protein
MAVAAIVLACAARTGWPTEITDRESGTIEGLDLHEMTLRRTVSAWPLRHPRSLDASSRLAAEGVTVLQAQPNRDRVFLAAAPTVGTDDVPLAQRLCAAWLRAHLRANHGAYVGERDDAACAQTIGTLLGDFLASTGQGVDIQLGLAERPEGAPRRFVADVRTGLASLRGGRVAVEVDA